KDERRADARRLSGLEKGRRNGDVEGDDELPVRGLGGRPAGGEQHKKEREGRDDYCRSRRVATDVNQGDLGTEMASAHKPPWSERERSGAPETSGRSPGRQVPSGPPTVEWARPTYPSVVRLPGVHNCFFSADRRR